tara:strand:- start:694 stop:1413 length:720 start_codon:yes stop_codon:yes gene_type:complete
MKQLKSLKGKKIALIGMGGSQVDYAVSLQNSIEYDETWGINSTASTYKCDRVFMLDPASRFFDTEDAGMQTDVMRKLLPKLDVPVYTCELDARVPNAVLYPLEEVINYSKCAYLNNTVAYAVAFAHWNQVAKLDIFGIDFSYAGNLHFAEAGRACVEFWLAKCISDGIEIGASHKSSLLDSNVDYRERLYGYHRLNDPVVAYINKGKWVISKNSDFQKAKLDQVINVPGDVKPPEPSKG